MNLCFDESDAGDSDFTQKQRSESIQPYLTTSCNYPYLSLSYIFERPQYVSRHSSVHPIRSQSIMGGKAKKPQRTQGPKRKAGFLGFQSSEIAFIEDEMATIAAEYGLSIDQEVASHVRERKNAKRARHRKASGGATSNYAPRVQLLRPAAPRKIMGRVESTDDHAIVLERLKHLLPEGGQLSKCSVPGCACSNGHRELSLDSRSKKEQDNASSNATARVDAIRSGQCKKCQHGVLQHGVLVRESEGLGKPSGGQRLLSRLYELVRFARIAGCIYSARTWTASSLELISSLLSHVRHQMTAGGTQNGQQGDVLIEQQMIAELQTQLQHAQQAVGKATREELPIQLACALDQMYFQTYYATIVLFGRACAAVPDPESYFADLEALIPDLYDQVEEFVNRELKGALDVLASLALPMASETAKRQRQGESIALLQIYRQRFCEGIRLFYEQGVGSASEMEALLADPTSAAAALISTKKKVQKKNYRRERRTGASTSGGAGTSGKTAAGGLVELPCYPLLAQWRNNCRDWGCHLYAYATPTPEALTLMAKYAPLVEMGAGTGYWSSLLQQQKIDIVAYDKYPPGSIESASAEQLTKANAPAARPAQERNAYHGHVPPFCTIAKGGPDTLLNREELHKRNLFLCYPPPNDKMAAECLEYFQGESVIHVGEWQGDTGDRTFERVLSQRFVLVKELVLPNWGNSAYSLTVWTKKKKSVIGKDCKSLSCFVCSTTGEDAELKRCVFCKTNVYCSDDCEERHRSEHAAEHAKRLLFWERDDALDFENDAHYKPLFNIEDSSDKEDDEDDEEEKEEAVSSDEQEEEDEQSDNDDEKEAPKDVKAFTFNFGA